MVRSPTFPLQIAIVCFLAACHPGGEYATGGRSAARGDDPDAVRGETNGRMFDFVSNKPEGDDWQLRIRGSSLWAAYGHDDSPDELGTKNLSNKETQKVWDLIDKLDIAGRKKGKPDEDEGYVSFRLREPGGENGHDIYEVYISRATEDEDVIELAEYLQVLVKKHFKEKPNF